MAGRDYCYRLVDMPSRAPCLPASIGGLYAAVLVAGLPLEPAHSSIAVARLLAPPRLPVLLNGTTGDAEAAWRQVRDS
jgi:hypothetical protein